MKQLPTVGWSCAIAALMFWGCHAKTPVKPPAPTPPAATPQENQEPSLRDKVYQEVPEITSVHFDVDAATLRAEDREVLKHNYDVLAQHKDWEILVEGHCDERGTDAYNLGLGQRRAAVVRQYYMALGFPGIRVATISYGKEQPVCSEHNEDCWFKNRRGVTKVRSKKLS